MRNQPSKRKITSVRVHPLSLDCQLPKSLSNKLTMQESSASESIPTSATHQTREENKPRRSPPPLVSMDGTRRDSLVGLQRLVYSSQIFTHSRTSHEDPRPVANIGENVVEVKPGPRSAHSQTRPSLPSPKPKRSRTSFTPTQLERLEEEFSVDMYVVGLKRMKLANELNLSERQVKVWFQNRRMKYKRERAKSRSDGGKLN